MNSGTRIIDKLDDFRGQNVTMRRVVAHNHMDQIQYEKEEGTLNSIDDDFIEIGGEKYEFVGRYSGIHTVDDSQSRTIYRNDHTIQKFLGRAR